jgi:hydrocephalus-inducing protein
VFGEDICLVVHDPVFDEGKKEEKKGKEAKKGDKQVVVEEEKKEEEEQDYSGLLKGERLVSVIPLHFNGP